MNPIQTHEIIKKQQQEIMAIRNGVREQNKSIEQALEAENAAVKSMLEQLNETLKEAITEIHSRQTETEIVLEAFIKLVLVSDNPDVTETEYNELKDIVAKYLIKG